MAHWFWAPEVLRVLHTAPEAPVVQTATQLAGEPEMNAPEPQVTHVLLASKVVEPSQTPRTWQAVAEFQDEQMNKVLYTLTIVTTSFLPAQFLSGLYGMNFEYMPELQERKAYFVWWGAVILSVSAVLTWFKYNS